MFGAVLCSSSGGQIVLLQRLVSSPSVKGLTERRLRTAYCKALNRRTVRPVTGGDDTRCCNNTISPPEDEHKYCSKYVEAYNVIYILL
jgi:hypothetical protein